VPPLVSLILVVKNGMPYLPEAIASVGGQTYGELEVIVQDGSSTDGTVDYLRSVDDVPLDIVSEPDGGIGDAYNRAVGRCRGEIVGSIDADNLLERDAVAKAVEFLSGRPGAAAAYGGSNMVAADGALLYPWMPVEFDLLKLLTFELVPPFATSFFVRALCGDELHFDESLRTCADFDLWLRISHLPIARIDAILGSTRLSDASMTRRVETYDQYITDKSLAIELYLARLEPSPLVDAVRRHALCGLHAWAADSVYDIEGVRTPQFERYLSRARELDPTSERVARLAERTPVQDAPEPETPEQARPSLARRIGERVRAQSRANSDL
jgi:glycosyltransferase involved in cell wall biosynthesis